MHPNALAFQKFLLQEFSFLLDLGFEVRWPSGEACNCYMLTFAREDCVVEVEGINWGLNASLKLMPRKITNTAFDLEQALRRLGLEVDVRTGNHQWEQVKVLANLLHTHLTTLLSLPKTFWDIWIEDQEQRRIHREDPEPEAFRALCREVLDPVIEQMKAIEVASPDWQAYEALPVEGAFPSREHVVAPVDFDVQGPTFGLELESNCGRLEVWGRDLTTGVLCRPLELLQRHFPSEVWKDRDDLHRLELYRMWLEHAVPLWLEQPFWTSEALKRD